MQQVSPLNEVTCALTELSQLISLNFGLLMATMFLPIHKQGEVSLLNERSCVSFLTDVKNVGTCLPFENTCLARSEHLHEKLADAIRNR